MLDRRDKQNKLSKERLQKPSWLEEGGLPFNVKRKKTQMSRKVRNKHLQLTERVS